MLSRMGKNIIKGPGVGKSVAGFMTVSFVQHD